MKKVKHDKASRLHAVITAPFASPEQTAKILGVSTKRLMELRKLVNRGKS